MKKLNTLAIAAALGVTLGASVVAIAADSPEEKAVKARQGLMQVYSFNMGIMSAMAKGKMPYDAEMASNAAANLLAAVSMKNGPMWPAGSDEDSVEGSRAKATLWSTYPEVAEKGKAMMSASTDLASVAGNGLDALKGAMGPVGKGCKGCHDDFRAKKK